MTRHYRPRHARNSPLWQCLHDSLETFTTGYYLDRSKYLGPLDPSRETALRESLRCGDLASGFTRLQCPDCGHERLLAFTCKGRHFCPSCHQRRVRSTSDWIATSVCHVGHGEVALGYRARKFETHREFDIASPASGDIIGRPP